jgi:hypothetical protein
VNGPGARAEFVAIPQFKRLARRSVHSPRCAVLFRSAHRFPYTQFKEAIELMKSGGSSKIVLEWSGASSPSHPEATSSDKITVEQLLKDYLATLVIASKDHTITRFLRNKKCP